ncbi:MAG: ribonuclease HII [bacterium]|nr:ribonuclease HII [bacterium]
MKRKHRSKFFIGIDEVGRGPLAGPVAVGALVATPKLIKEFCAIKESKQLSPLQREEWYARMLSSCGKELRFAVSFVSADIIDKKGIVFAIRLALTRSLKKLKVSPSACTVLLDGGLYAPKEYRRQKTIIRGDTKETVIAMASVVAKVLRDRRMVRLHKRYPKYGFAAHKGYGTKVHYRALKEYGLSPEHRRSFLRTCALFNNVV